MKNYQGGKELTWSIVILLSVYMDSNVWCGRTIPVGEESRIVEPRGTVDVSHPVKECIVMFESSYTESAYEFEITVERANIRDCALKLRIFNGANSGGSYIVSHMSG